MAGYERIVQGFDPVFDERSRVLVLGSIPSVLSRANAFYYGNPQNRFWRVIAACAGEEVPPNAGEVPGGSAGERGLGEALGAPVTLERSIELKRALLLRHGIALWDVIESCDIKGSSDASIRDVVPAKIERVLEMSPIEAVLCNGGAAGRLYKRYLQQRAGLTARVLPSTSPANAAWSLEMLVARWSEALGPYI